MRSSRLGKGSDSTPRHCSSTGKGMTIRPSASCGKSLMKLLSLGRWKKKTERDGHLNTGRNAVVVQEFDCQRLFLQEWSFVNSKSSQANDATQMAIWSLRHIFSRRKMGRRDWLRIYTGGMKEYLLNCVFLGLLIRGKEGGQLVFAVLCVLVCLLLFSFF